MSPAMLAAHLFINAEACLLSGHTTAWEVAGADGALRDAIDAGLVPGPRLYPSGPLLCQTGGHGETRHPFFDHHHATSIPGSSTAPSCVTGPMVFAPQPAPRSGGAPRRSRCACRAAWSHSVTASTTRNSRWPSWPQQWRRPARDTYVTAHAHNSAGINNGLEAGLECFEHGTFLDEKTARAMAAAGAALVPTLTVAHLLRSHAAAWGVPEEVLPKIDPVLEAMERSVALARDVGVTIGSGSDILGPHQTERGLEIGYKAASARTNGVDRVRDRDKRPHHARQR